MAEPVLNVRTVFDNKTVQVPYTPTTTAEDVCISLCKQLGVGTVARHIFALRDHSKHTFLMPSATFEAKTPLYDLRIRFKVAHVLRLKKVDIKAYDYYFHQARSDVLENKVPELSFEKYRRELVGLGVTDMYRVMLEKDIPRETVESDYKKYIPKEVLKRHAFFIKKPIHDTLGKIRKAGHDAWYVKEEYLKQLEMMVPDYPFEEYKALMDQNGSVCNIHVRVVPYHANEPGVKYCFESKREKWFQICTIDELGFVSIRKDCTVELSRRNGIPFYLKFSSLSNMYSFVSLLDGYYRLTSKWTFNICKDVPTPSLQRLYSMKCHGPVGGEFSYAKLEEKRNNMPGCFILRESESRYNIYFLDVCMKDSLKPKTYKLERLSGDEFIFNDDLTRYQSLAQLMASYKNSEGSIYLAECLPPSEYDTSPLLLCKRSNISGDTLADGTEDLMLPSGPICINTKDLQVYKDVNCLKWNKKRKMVKVNDTFERIEKFDKYRFPDEDLSSAKKYCRNPDGDLAGPWCFVEIEHGNEVEKMYCDIPFCDGQDCSIFSRNHVHYTDYINFPKTLSNLSFGVKLWDPDSFLEAKAKLVLALLPLPISGPEMEELGIGIEILLTNKNSALTIGNKDSPEYEPTNAILKSTEYTFFSLSWDHGFITLNRENNTKPVFLQEFKTKGNLMGFKRDQFLYYSAMGNNVLWSFPFCEDDGECDVHTTGSEQNQNFMSLREKNVGHDLSFHLRATHSAVIFLVPSPVIDFPNVKILLGSIEGMARIVCTEFAGGPTVTLKEASFPNLISYWKWGSFSITLFADGLQIYWNRDVGTFMIIEVKHEVVRSLRWFSPASRNNLAHWTFYCDPPEFSNPLPAYLPECALNEHETNYIGTQDLTHNGLPCLPWSGQKLIPADIRNLHKDKAILEMYNYCRDPKHEKMGTYCYAISETDAKRIDKHYCKLRKCKSAECKMAGTGNDYIGKVNRTRSNRTCQFWVTESKKHENPQTINATHKTIRDVKDNKQESLITENKNNRFNVSKQKNSSEDYEDESADNKSSQTEIQHTKTSNTSLNNNNKHEHNASQYNTHSHNKSLNNSSNIKNNSQDVTNSFVNKSQGINNQHNKTITSSSDKANNNEHPENNISSHNHTATLSNNTEMNIDNKDLASEISNISHSINDYLQEMPHADKARMVKVHDVDEAYLNGTLYADMSAEMAENFCRNPSRSLAGSWCYTTDKDTPQEACHVPDCDKNEECTVLVKGKGHGQKREGAEGLTVVYKCMWKHVKGKRVEVAMKVLKMDHKDKYLKDFLELSGHWAFLQSNVIVRLFGVTLTSQLSMVMEYIRLGPLDEYLREKKTDIKFVDLLEASSNLAAALWHLAENSIVHGNIRCRKLLVSCHDENSFRVKLADPGIHTAYASKEVHWIPVECYKNLDFARRTTAADVWAFSTTLWEIFMCGESIKQTDHSNAMRFYGNGKRLPQPQLCTLDIYKLMLECWDSDPHRRKQPQAIMRDINQILYQTYNSRKQHAYAKVKHFDSLSIESIYSNTTESTNVTSQEELISVFDMSETDSDLNSKSSLWSVNFEKSWLTQDADNNEDAFFNFLPNFDFSAATTSLDNINSIQSIFELNEYCVVLQGRIGQGFFGEVYKGTLEHHGDPEIVPRLVAVKKLKQSALSSCLQDFEMEIKIMKKLKHPNIVEILGVVQHPEIQLVMEYVPHGSLQSYLKIYKDNLSIKQLLTYALDIAKGMDYLGKMNIVHRDLAARNILVVDENHVKISDFGLARVIDTNSYYILKRDTELPIKWYALESLRVGKFSTKSDVWSYGVTMCEMFSHGEEPNLPNDVGKTEGQILLDALEKGIRFPRPVNCPSFVYARLIHPCWDKDPHVRPPFVDLCREIEELLTQY